jgi:predicted Zn-dependent protease
MVPRGYGYSSRRGGGCGGRLIIAALMVGVSLFTYFSSRSTNEVTGEVQHVSMTPEQEVAMGLQAAPEVAAEFGGLDANNADQQVVDQIGQSIVQQSPAGTTPYEYDFHLLADTETINAFALPGGQIFITRALYDRLQTEGQLAGVLGHETGHVVARHSAEQIAKAQLTEGLTGAAIIAACDPNNPNGCVAASQMAALVGQLINMRFSREDELESDWLGVCFMNDSGYDPNDMIGVMEILDSASQGQGPPEFLSTHPDPGNRIERIQENMQNIDQCP